MRLSLIPNIISVLRMLLVPPVVVLLLNGRYGVALLLFVIAGLSDALDGYLAKHCGWTSRLGAILDPLADKLLLVSSYLTLGWLGHLPIWLVALVAVRDLVIVGGGVAYHFKVSRFEPAPTVLSKLNTLAQILLIVSVLFAQGVWPLPAWVPSGLMYVVLITTVVSGLSYVWTWGIRALRAAWRVHD